MQGIYWLYMGVSENYRGSWGGSSVTSSCAFLILFSSCSFPVFSDQLYSEAGSLWVCVMTAKLSWLLPPERELLSDHETKVLAFTLTSITLLSCNSFTRSGESIIERQVRMQNLGLSKNLVYPWKLILVLFWLYY